MTDTGVNAFIIASREELYDLIIDTSRHGDYVKGYVDQVSGPKILEQGTEHIWRINLYGTIFRVFSYVSLIEYPGTYVEKMHIPGLFRMTLMYTLEEEGRGVNLGCTWQFAPVSWSTTGIIAERLTNAGETVHGIISENVAGMKRLLEVESFQKKCEGGKR